MSLKDAFAGKFLMGAALNTGQVDGSDSVASAIVARHFNSIVAEDDMKCEKIHPEENTYYWKDSDRFV
ncbi:MAG: endo-1,4-beta-xylanase, partial [Muribaculaceae bacterium]|nr:endo-1,4-beta-xylanase [Muribaculaceae bacterium]